MKGGYIAKLEVKCPSCNGTKSCYDSETDSFLDCKECGGSGFKPTAIGKQILTLIRHNSKVNITAELYVSGAPS